MLGGANLATNLPGGLDAIRESIREQQATMPIFASAPMVIQESLLFPYLSGFEFVRRYKVHHPGSSATILDSLPTSTEEVLHEPAFFGKQRDEPSDVVLPRTADTSAHEETLGEFGTRLFLYEHLKNNIDAVGAAQGWDGDRYRVVHTPKGDGIVWVTVWDSGADAAQFVDALGQAIGKRYRTSAPTVSAAGVRTYTGRGRTVVITPLESGGQDVVMYVDVPAGAPTNVIPAARIAIRAH
jgi:hypothetical protein